MNLDEACEKSKTLYAVATGRKLGEVRLGHLGKAPAGQPAQAHWTATIGEFNGSGPDALSAVLSLVSRIEERIRVHHREANARAAEYAALVGSST